MLRSGNIRRRCVAATALAVNMLVTPLPAASASPSDLATPVCLVASGITALKNNPGIDSAQVLEAFARTRGWVTEFNAPQMESPDARIALAEATGVCVILRRQGRVLGVGMDDAADDLMLRRAVGRALNETLSDPALQAVASAIRRDAGAGGIGAAGVRPDSRPDQEAEARLEALRRDVGRSLTLELEVAGPRKPLVGATLGAMAGDIEPGVDGLSLRRERKWSHAFPANLRTANLGGEPLKTLTSLAVNAGIPMAELRDATLPADASFYSFRTIDLVQRTPDEPPMELLRGERLVPMDAITRPHIESLANSLARHLLRRRFPEPPEGQARLPLGFMGDYNPVSDQFAQNVAPPLDQALCALALTRFAQTSGMDADAARDAAAAARQALRDLAEQAPGEELAIDDRHACAVMLMVICDMPSCMGDSHIAAMIRQAHARLLSALDPAQQAQGPMTPMMRAMIGCALARTLISKIDALPAPSTDRVRALLDQAWSGASENQSVGMLPWLGWAERDFAIAAGQPLAHAEEFKRMLAALDRVRVGDGPEIAADLVGGLALTGAGSQGAGEPRPTSQTARPAAWLASIATDTSLITADQQPLAWGRHLATIRFICQLVVSDVRAATFRNPARAVGGVCTAPWDSRQPLPAQAMVLIATVETLKNWPKSPD